MKLALVISSLDGGGAERVLSLLANFWAARGDEVTLVTLDDGTNDRYSLHPRVHRATHNLMKPSGGALQGTAANLRRIGALRRALVDSGADAIVSFGEQTNVLMLLATLGTGLRRIVSERTDPAHHPIGAVWRLMRRLTYPFADALVAPSAAVAEWATRVMRSERVHVIHNPLRALPPVAAGSAGENIITAVGRLAPEKGVDVLLNAFAAVANALPAWRLELVGEGPERTSLGQLAARLGIAERVTFAGWLQEPGEALARSRIFVLPSRYEGFPNALLEAMAMGLPVVSTASKACREIVTDGVDGVLVPIDSAAELGAAIARLASDGSLRQRLGRAACAVRERYRLESVARRWDAVLKPPASPREGVPRIVFITRALDIGGAERQLCEVAIGLHRAGWRVKVVSFYRGGLFEERLKAAGVLVECIDKRGRWDLWTFFSRIVRAVRSERPHVVHGNLGLPNVLATLFHFAWPQARTVWWVAASRADLKPDDWLVRLEARLGALLSRFADLIICNSEAGLRHHVELGYPSASTVVVPNGIDVDEFKPDGDARATVRAQWSVAGSEKLIGLVARLDPIKDHPNFLRAAHKVLAARPDVRFVCVGDGPAAYRTELESLARELKLADRVIWAGERSDMARVYNALDLAVSASQSEGLPNALAEALATGVACVATDVGDSAELVRPGGWVCPPGDSDALADAMLTALGAQRDGAAARARICSGYSTGAMLDRTLAHLTPLVAAAAPRTAA